MIHGLHVITLHGQLPRLRMYGNDLSLSCTESDFFRTRLRNDEVRRSMMKYDEVTIVEPEPLMTMFDHAWLVGEEL